MAKKKTIAIEEQEMIEEAIAETAPTFKKRIKQLKKEGITRENTEFL